MKILMLSWEYPPRIVGGISRVVHDLSHKLTKDGHEVTVVTYKDGDVPYVEDDDGVKVYRVDNFMIAPNNFIDWIMQLNFNMIARVGELIKEGQTFDIIHAHDWLVAYAAKTLKFSYGIPMISTIHATEAGRNSGIRTDEQRYINDTEWMLTYESSEVIVNSNYMKSELQRLFGLPYEKINVIPNGVNLSNFNNVYRDYDFRRRFAMDNEKIILFMGRLVYEKGIQNLIAAMPKILEYYHDAKLVIAGKGGMIDELKNEVNSLGISNKVYFAGYLNSNDVKKMYKCADVSVFPSTYEPFGIVAIEAMLSGTPVVVSDIGGLNEIDQELTQSLCDQAEDMQDTDVLPAEILLHLPYPCVYLKCPGFVEHIDGFFTWIEWDVDRKASELRVQMVTEGFDHSFPMLLHLIPGGTVGECINDTLQTTQELSGKEFDREDTSFTIMLSAIQMILYISAENADVLEEPAPVRPVRDSAKAERRILDKAGEVRGLDVGVRVGAALRKARRKYEGTENPGTGARKRAHTRRGHWHHYWTGPKNGERKLVLKWTAPTFIHPEDGMDDGVVVFPVK